MSGDRGDTLAFPREQAGGALADPHKCVGVAGEPDTIVRSGRLRAPDFPGNFRRCRDPRRSDSC